MRKRSIIGVTCLIFGASLATAAPARASIRECNFEPAPATSTVVVENGEIRLNPSGPSSDVAAYRDWVIRHVSCWVNETTAPETVSCIAGLGVGGPYIYQDPYTGQYVVAYQALIDHAAALAACAG